MNVYAFNILFFQFSEAAEDFGAGGRRVCDRALQHVCNTISGLKVRQMTPADNGVINKNEI